MKRRLLFFIASVFVLGVCTTHYVSGASVGAVKKKINVDGIATDWVAIEADTLANNAPDLEATYKVAWDSENIYFLVNVKDDTAAVYKTGDYVDEKAYHVDNIEIFIDPDDSDSTEKDGINDVQIRSHRDTLVEGAEFWTNHVGVFPGVSNGQNVIPGGLAELGIIVAEVADTNGYMQEISIPWTLLTKEDPNLSPEDFMDGDSIGFGFQIRDMDAVGEYMSVVGPGSINGAKPSTYDTLVLLAATEPVTVMATTSNTISIDGTFADWDTVKAYSVGMDNAPDLAVTYKVARDIENIYLLVDVQDDTVAVLGEGDYKDEKSYNLDNIEVFFDMDNSKSEAMDDLNDFQIRFMPDTLVVVGKEEFSNILGVIPTINKDPGSISPVYDSTHWEGLSAFGIEIEEMMIDGQGYKKEISIPISFLTAADPNLDSTDYYSQTEIGFRIQVTDRDAVELGKNKEMYPAESVWNDPASWGTLVLDSVEAPAPVDIWKDVPAFELTKDIDDSWTDSADFSGNFKIQYNDTAIMLLFDVTDDIITPVPSGGTIHEFDGAEIHFDLGNEKTPGSYEDRGYDNNDYQIKTFLMDTVYIGHYTDGSNSKDVSYDSSDVQVSTDTASNGYQMEVIIPYKTFVTTDGNTPIQAGDTIGFEVNITDNDGIVRREARLGWYHDGVDAYADPSAFGTLVALADGTFKADTATPVSTPKLIELTHKLSIYPNPVNNSLTVEGMDIASIQVIDMTGRTVLLENNEQTVSVREVSVSNLTSGVYFIQIETQGNIVTKQFIKQ